MPIPNDPISIRLVYSAALFAVGTVAGVAILSIWFVLTCLYILLKQPEV